MEQNYMVPPYTPDGAVYYAQPQSLPVYYPTYTQPPFDPNMVQYPPNFCLPPPMMPPAHQSRDDLQVYTAAPTVPNFQAQNRENRSAPHRGSHPNRSQGRRRPAKEFYNAGSHHSNKDNQKGNTLVDPNGNDISNGHTLDRGYSASHESGSFTNFSDSANSDGNQQYQGFGSHSYEPRSDRGKNRYGGARQKQGEYRGRGSRGSRGHQSSRGRQDQQRNMGKYDYSRPQRDDEEKQDPVHNTTVEPKQSKKNYEVLKSSKAQNSRNKTADRYSSDSVPKKEVDMKSTATAIDDVINRHQRQRETKSGGNFTASNNQRQSNEYRRGGGRDGRIVNSGNARQQETKQQALSKRATTASKDTNWRNRHGRQNLDDESQRGSLIEQLSNNEYECMVCCETVRCEAAVWSCVNCYHVFHLRCVKRWARSPTAVVEGGDINNQGWRCPACQNVCSKFPMQYRCFCNKVRDPVFNCYETPHSCGDMCGRKRSEDCKHPCNILCHPGPCPPCQATVTKQCDCGKSKQTVKCGQGSLKCTKVCEKLLNCGQHECKEVCHPGSCSPCEDIIKQACYCESKSREVICGTSESFVPQYSCQEICGRKLDCGHHECGKKCHPGSCDSCELLPSAVTHCPCGAVALSDLAPSGEERTSCLDAIPVCDNICDKILPCGPEVNPHHCQKKCHVGPCDSCDGITPVTCRCGRLQKEISCHEASQYSEENPLTCDKRCSKKRQCGRHKCGQMCCISDDHPCEQLCGLKLTCNQHRCEEPCHRGNCPPCWQVSFDELPCHCGAEILYPPIPCGTKPPECQKVCTRQHNCDHIVRHNCHSDSQCTPCTELTQKWCMGEHEIRRNIACHLPDISCGLPCKKPLSCGLHTCLQICHKGACQKEDEKCTQPCIKPRTECGHPCAAPCHPEIESCPKSSCQMEVSVKCKCGNRQERVKCMMGGEHKENIQEYQRMATMMMAMKMADIQDGQTIDISSLTSSDSKKRTRELECTSECAVKERNRRLALALEIQNPDLNSKLFQPPYSDFLKNFTKQNPAFIAGVEKAYSELVHNAQSGKQPRRRHAFPVMNREKRRVVHELGDFYGCETEAHDEEPNRNVVATATKNKCWHPKETLTSLVQRELYPKAPVPIPFGSKEEDIRSTVQSSRQSTSIMGTAGWVTPRAQTAGGGSANHAGSAATSSAGGGTWASRLKSGPPQAAAPAPKPEVRTSTFETLRKREPESTRKDDKKSEPEVDYFDLTS